MTTVGAYEAKTHFSQLLDRVAENDRRRPTLLTFVLDSSVTLAWVFEDEGADAGGDTAQDSLLTSLLREDARVPALWPRQGSRGAGGLTAGTSVRSTRLIPASPPGLRLHLKLS